MARSNSYEASIRFDLENATELEKQLASIFSDPYITNFREKMDAAFRSRKGFLNEQKELAATLERARQTLAQMVKEGNNNKRVAQELRAVGTLVEKAQKEILNLERQRVSAGQDLLNLKKQLLKQGEVDDKTNRQALKGIQALSAAERGVQKEIEAQADAIQHRRNLIEVSRKERERGVSVGAKLAASEERVTAAIVGRTKAAIRGGQSEEEATDRVTDAIAERIRAEIRAGEAAEDAAKKAEKGQIKTTLAGQNVLRIIQDSQYGMMGMANNIEQLSESLVHMYQKEVLLNGATGALGRTLKGTFMPLVVGPMAIATIVTLTIALTSSTDKLAAAYDGLRKKLGFLSQQQVRYNQALREQENIRKRARAGEYVSEEIGNITELSEIERRREGIGMSTSSARRVIARGKPEGFDDWENGQDVAEGVARRGGAMGPGGVFELPAEINDRSFTTLQLQRFDEYKQALKLLDDNVATLAELDTREAELRAEEQAVLDSGGGLTVEAAMVEADTDTPSDAEVRRGLNADLELRSLQVAAMKEGPEKRAAQVRLQYDELRRQYAQEEGRTAAQKQQLIDATHAAEEQALEDVAADREEIDRQIRDARIAAMEDEKARRIAEIDAQYDSELEAHRNNAELTAEDLAEIERYVEERRGRAKREEIERQEEQTRELRRNHRESTIRYAGGTESITAAARAPLFNQMEYWEGRDAQIRDRSESRLAQNTAEVGDVTRARNDLTDDVENGRYETEEERERMLDWIGAYNDRLLALKDEEKRIVEEANAEIIENEKEKRLTIVAAYGQIASEMSAVFGNMASVVSGQSDEAFKAQQKFLYVQAVMDAISAGVGIYQSYATSKTIPAPYNMIIAGVQSAAVVSTLMGKAKQIKNMSLDGAGGGNVTGGYTTLNGAMTGKRISEYEGDRRGRERGDAQQQSEAIEKLTARIGDLKVVMDDATASEVYNTGKKIVTRNRI